MTSVKLPSFYSFPLNEDVIWEWEYKKQDSTVVLKWYKSDNELLKELWIDESLHSSKDILHLLKEEVFYHLDGNSVVYKLDDKLNLNGIIDVKDCSVTDLHIGSDKLFFVGLSSEGICPVLVCRDKIYKLPVREDKNHIGLPNDIDGGIDFWPRNISYSGEIYTWYNIEELKVKVSRDNPGQVRNPKAAERLEDMLEGLPEDVNVVVAVLKEKCEK